ncbi:MAG: hypothetical protein JST96_11035 [Bacteroidetes bacterium]|nr:hypothetical protein [Bacteroidota bacterium]
MLSILLFVFYVFVLTAILVRCVKVKQIAIKSSILISAFLFKVLLGCIYGYIFLKYYGGDDTWVYHKASLKEYQLLIHNPAAFFKDFLPFSAIAGSHNFWESVKFYISDLEYCFTEKPLAFFNIFSRGNYYINVAFFDFFIFFGPLILFKLLHSLFPTKKNVLILIIFFLPTTSFWLSGIRTEGLLLLSIAVAIYFFYKWAHTKKIIFSLLSILGLMGMLILRAEFLFAFLPAFVAYSFCTPQKQKSLYVFLFSNFLSALIFFGSLLISSENNFPKIVADRQHNFFLLHGNTVLKLDTLQPTLTSFIKILPQAMSNTFFHPLLWQAKGALQILSALDVLAFWILILLAIFQRIKDWKQYLLHPLILLFIFYGVIQTILIGYIVPFPGAIVRYKIIPELLLVLAMALIVDWKIFSTNNRK